MSRYYSYLNSARQILQQYNGEEPFSAFLKKYFSDDKKYGSKDRKQISHLCYCYFRLGKGTVNMSIEERVLIGLFLCSSEPNEMLQQLKPEWNDKFDLSIEEKRLLLQDPYPPFRPDENRGRNEGGLTLNVFPWVDELSDGVGHEKFNESFFIQPDLFLRLRPGKESIVKQKLQEAGIEFKIINDDCMALSNSSKIDGVVELNKEAVVQDYSSQRVGEFLIGGQTGTVRPGMQNYNSQRVGEFLVIGQTGTARPGEPFRVWDCCAASGGKSIMAKDILDDIDLTVSDIRESILINLRKRFEQAGIKKFKSYITDLTNISQIPNSQFQLIICDAPCTGSGTWSRTPEQLYYFDKNEIDRYALLQKKIVSNTIPHLQAGGYFLYITCSVFKKENEEVVEFIRKNFQLNLIKMDILKGYDKKADTMFAALFRKPL